MSYCSDFFKAEKGLLVFVKLVQVTVHELKHECHFFYHAKRGTLTLVIEDIDKLDDVGMGEGFQRFDLLIFFDLVDIGVAVLHDFQCIFMTVETRDCHEDLGVCALSFFTLNSIVLHQLLLCS